MEESAKRKKLNDDDWDFLVYLDFNPTKTWRCKSTGASRGGITGTVILSRTWFAAGWLEKIRMKWHELINSNEHTRQDIRLWIDLRQKVWQLEWLCLMKGEDKSFERNIFLFRFLTIRCFHFHCDMCLRKWKRIILWMKSICHTGESGRLFSTVKIVWISVFAW